MLTTITFLLLLDVGVLLTPVVQGTTYSIANSYNATKEFNLAVSMDLYVDSQFTEKYTSPISIDYNDFIYVGINEDKSNVHFKFVVTQCFATKTTFTEGDVSDIFFDNKCSLDGTFSIKSVDGENDRFNFAVQAFYFIDEMESVYFNCRIKICTTDSTDLSCSQNCATSDERWRRDASDPRHRRHMTQSNGVLVTSQSVTVNDKRTCDEISPSCPTHSRCYHLHPVACVCDIGYVYSRPTKTCVQERLVQINDIHTAIEWNKIYDDTLTLDFLKLSRKYENLFYHLFQATGSTKHIQGIKLIDARRHSSGTVFDILLLRNQTAPDMDVYKAFMKSINSNILKVTTVRRKLKIIENSLPTLVRRIVGHSNTDTESLGAAHIVMIAVIALLSVMVIVSGVVLYHVYGSKSFKLRRLSTRKVRVYDNEGQQVESEVSY